MLQLLSLAITVNWLQPLKKNPLTINGKSPRFYAKQQAHSLRNKSVCHGTQDLHSLGTGVLTMETRGSR